MNVLAEWKAMLGAYWEKTYAASNTIYVTRQNNVLFSVLAQFFGPDAINNRLILIETVSFTTTPADLLQSLTRIIADRSVGSLFFGNYHLMDYELMGGDARAAIIAECAKRGTKAFLPPPAGRLQQWPTLVTPGRPHLHLQRGKPGPDAVSARRRRVGDRLISTMSRGPPAPASTSVLAGCRWRTRAAHRPARSS
jgi:hypothetical protein